MTKFPEPTRTIAALYVETNGCYFGLPGVEVVGHGEDHADATTTVHLDGRSYSGPWPVIAHPSCKRWGRFWHGSTRKPHQYKLGDDGGCFEHALDQTRAFGGVIEHPCDSQAWKFYGLATPPRSGGWVEADDFGGWTCCVDQGHYGHFANKLTWLYVCRVDRADLPELTWGKGEQRLHPVALEKHGYAKARKIGMMAMIGGKDKVRIRNRTPECFRDVLIRLARLATLPSPAPPLAAISEPVGGGDFVHGACNAA